MDFSKKPTALLYLDSKGFYFYEPAIANLVSLTFSQTSVRDMDVIDPAELETQIKNFVAQYQVTPSSISIVLSPNLTFEKEIVGLTPEEQQEAEKKFIDTIPFDDALTRSYPVPKGVKVIGCNNDLYLEIKSSFVKLGFLVDVLIPYQFLGADQALLQNLLVDNIATLLRKIDRYKQYNLVQEKPKVIVAPTVTPSSPNTPATKQAPKKMRLYAMVGVFVVLFAILGYMLMHMKP